MYHLFVSGDEESWNGDPWTAEISRCIHEYTDEAIIEAYGELTPQQVDGFRRFPCIFAYEAAHELAPKFGVIRDVTVRQRQVRVEYEIHEVTPFLSAEQLEKLSFELDVRNWEMNRTHWAMKDVDLAKELHRQGISLPAWARSGAKAVDITKHQFDVALSFPGEARGLVEQVARALEQRLGPDRYFYDNNYMAQLARPRLDTLLQDIYRSRSKLVVVFIGGDYQRKQWCGVEFRAIRDIIFDREDARIMFVRLDAGPVDGVFKTDGYIDAQRLSASEIAHFIEQRLALL
jgi:TIR domain